MNYIQPEWPAPRSIKAFTTVRHFWGEHYHDKKKLQSLLELPNEPIWINQTHSTIVLEAKPENKEKIADATYTRCAQQICAVLTADCLPILICNQQGSQVAAIHAGWRGLANGIIESTLKALQHSPADLLVWLGPAIGPEKFEVGMDVYHAFTQKNTESLCGFTKIRPNKWLANLYTLAKIRLQMQGIKHIFGGNFCTFTQEQLFFSYRREKNNTGRMASLIWIEAN